MTSSSDILGIEREIPPSMYKLLSSLSYKSCLHYPQPDKLNEENCLEMVDLAKSNIPHKPYEFTRDGIVICAGSRDGDDRYLTNAYINIKNLRDLGVDWPIQIWHKGQEEILGNFKELVKNLNVEFVDALSLKKILPARILNGWELKVYAIKWCPFNRILLLDADSFAVKNPLFIFDTEEFKKSGAIFFPDQRTLDPEDKIWKLMGIEYKAEREFESGQIFLDKNKTWGAICLTMWMNEYSDFFYKYFWGDKESFHFAWLKMGNEYFMGNPYKLVGPHHLQYWNYDLVFQHITWLKHSIHSEDSFVEGLQRADKHKLYIEELKKLWKL